MFLIQLLRLHHQQKPPPLHRHLYLPHAPPCSKTMAEMTPYVIAPVPHLAGMTPAVAEVHIGGVGVAGSLSLPVVSNPGSANANLAGGVGPAVAEVASGEVAERVYPKGIKNKMWMLLVEGPSSATVVDGPEQKPPAVTATNKRRKLPCGNEHDSAPTGAELSS